MFICVHNVYYETVLAWNLIGWLVSIPFQFLKVLSIHAEEATLSSAVSADCTDAAGDSRPSRPKVEACDDWCAKIRIHLHPSSIYHPYIYISNYIIHSRKTQDAIDFQWPWPSMAISISPTFSDLRILRRLWRPLCWASRDPKEALKLRKCEKFGPDLLAPLEVKKLAWPRKLQTSD
jgi:hypothetical protein